MEHNHVVVDADKHYVIDKNTRQITAENGNSVLMQYDHNSERLTFEMPRMIDGHDMTLCDIVQVHYLNVDSATRESTAGVYEVDDMQVSPTDTEKAILSWLISGTATKYAGTLHFVIKFKCTVDGSVVYAWSTDIYKGITVSSGIDSGEAIVEEYSDILAEWETRIEALEQNSDSSGATSWNDLTDKPFGESESGIKTIDEKYLPETVATKSYVEEMLGVIENGTY